MNDVLRRDALELLKFVDGTRPDFHEPDEQGVELLGVVGTKLDNAFGNNVDSVAVAEGYQEAVVCLRRQADDSKPSDYYKFNLATLFALAKRGAAEIVAEASAR